MTREEILIKFDGWDKTSQKKKYTENKTKQNNQYWNNWEEYQQHKFQYQFLYKFT